MEERNERQSQIVAKNEVLQGVYANVLYIAHTKEEVVMDFVLSVPPAPQLTARIITSPGHAKRIAKALQDTIGKYEVSFGAITPSEEPPQARMGFKLKD